MRRPWTSLSGCDSCATSISGRDWRRPNIHGGSPFHEGCATQLRDGTIILFQWSARGDGSALEIGWSFLARAYWGRGYNAEFKRLMLEHAFKSVDRVVFRVGAENVISRKAMANIGGRLTGETFVEERVGVPIEHVVYEITRDSFVGGPLAR